MSKILKIRDINRSRFDQFKSKDKNFLKKVIGGEDKSSGEKETEKLKV